MSGESQNSSDEKLLELFKQVEGQRHKFIQEKVGQPALRSDLNEKSKQVSSDKMKPDETKNQIVSYGASNPNDADVPPPSIASHEEKYEVLPHQTITPGAIVANVFLGIGTLGLLHAFFYLCSLIAKGPNMDNWHAKDFASWCKFKHAQRIHVDDLQKPLLDTKA